REVVEPPKPVEETVAEPPKRASERPERRTERPEPPRERAQPPAADQGSVRVSLPKLDALLTESGELSVTRLRVGERLQELRELHREMERWQREWHKSRPVRARMRRNGHRGREADVLLRAAEQADRQVQALVQRT